MSYLRDYILSLAAIAMICGVVLSLLPEGGRKGLIRLVIGAALVATALSPLQGIALPDLTSWGSALTQQGESLAARGMEIGEAARRERIKSAAESYILDKAEALGLALEAEVTLDEAGVPVGVRLSGEVSPYLQLRLSERIAEDLGITKENQQWTGQN